MIIKQAACNLLTTGRVNFVTNQFMRLLRIVLLLFPFVILFGNEVNHEDSEFMFVYTNKTKLGWLITQFVLVVCTDLLRYRPITDSGDNAWPLSLHALFSKIPSRLLLFANVISTILTYILTLVAKRKIICYNKLTWRHEFKFISIELYRYNCPISCDVFVKTFSVNLCYRSSSSS